MGCGHRRQHTKNHKCVYNPPLPSMPQALSENLQPMGARCVAAAQAAKEGRMVGRCAAAHANCRGKAQHKEQKDQATVHAYVYLYQALQASRFASRHLRFDLLASAGFLQADGCGLPARG